MDRDLISISKFLSLVLRHRPEKIGIRLDDEGWVQIDTLLAAANRSGRKLTRPRLERVVRENDKQRFVISVDGKRIRANQGHSVAVNLGLQPVILVVEAGRMWRDEHLFYRSENGVWLTEHVPSEYLHARDM